MGRAGLAGRAEGHGVESPPGVAPPRVRAFEGATAEAVQKDVLSVPEHDEVGDPVAIDVDRIGARALSEIGRGIAQAGEPKGPPDGAVVPEESRGTKPAGEGEVGLPRPRAVQAGDPPPRRVPKA